MPHAIRKRLCIDLSEEEEDFLIHGIISGAVDRKLLPFFKDAPLNPALENALSSFGKVLGILPANTSEATTKGPEHSVAAAKAQTFDRTTARRKSR